MVRKIAKFDLPLAYSIKVLTKSIKFKDIHKFNLIMEVGIAIKSNNTSQSNY